MKSSVQLYLDFNKNYVRTEDKPLCRSHLTPRSFICKDLRFNLKLLSMSISMSLNTFLVEIREAQSSISSDIDSLLFGVVSVFGRISDHVRTRRLHTSPLIYTCEFLCSVLCISVFQISDCCLVVCCCSAACLD